MSDPKGGNSDAGSEGGDSKKEEKKVRRGKGFLRNVLDGWRSSVASSQDSQSSTGKDDKDHLATPHSSTHNSADKYLEEGHRRLKLDLAAPTDDDPTPGTSPIPPAVDPIPAAPVPPPVVKPGFLFRPTCVTFDPVQRVIGLGNVTGFIRIIPLLNPEAKESSKEKGVVCAGKHPNIAAVIQIAFVINEGTLVSLCADDHIHLWTWNRKGQPPDILHTLKFNRERLSVFHLPVASKWLFMGSERGNVHVANADNFQLSGYVINWNKAIEVSQKTHPGAIVHLSDCPIDPSKLLIGYESGTIILWDLRSRSADTRISYHEALTSITWHHEGRFFVCSHTDGSFTTWELRATKPSSVLYPHARTITEDLKIEPCHPIHKIQWRTCRSDDPFTIFTGGHPYGSIDAGDGDLTELSEPVGSTSAVNDSSSSLAPGTPQPNLPSSSTSSSSSSKKGGASPCSLPSVVTDITIIKGKGSTVLEMKHSILDFITLCDTPYECDFNDPFAILVLLHNDLMFIDLSGPGKKDDSPDPLSYDGPKYSVTSILPDDEPDQIGTPFTLREMPEPPKQGFFKGLFSGPQPSPLDREELFGETGSGKPLRTIAKTIPGGGLDPTKMAAGGLASELAKARQGLTERGEHLEKLEDKTAQMSNEAQGFREMSHQLLNKYKEKKWYQF